VVAAAGRVTVAEVAYEVSEADGSGNEHLGFGASDAAGDALHVGGHVGMVLCGMGWGAAMGYQRVLRDDSVVAVVDVAAAAADDDDVQQSQL
jgi:hypothetical protein